MALNPLFGLNNKVLYNSPVGNAASGIAGLRALAGLCRRAGTQAIKNTPGRFPNGKKATIIGPKRKG